MDGHGKKSNSVISHIFQLVVAAAVGYVVAMLLAAQHDSTLAGPRGLAHWIIRAPQGAASNTTAKHTFSKTQPTPQWGQSQVPPAADLAVAPSWPTGLPPAPWPFPGVRGFYSENDKALTPWCNDTFSRQHPLTPADFERSYRPGGACSSSIMPPGLLVALESGSRELTITVVGGSMTHGSHCAAGPDPTCPPNDSMCSSARCAWPNKVQSRLRQLYPSGRVVVHNMAQPAWSYGRWIEAGVIDTLVKSDVLIIDLQVNSMVYGEDVFRQMEDVDEFIYAALTAAERQQRSMGVLFVESFLTCGDRTARCDAICPEHRQGRMVYNFTGSNSTYRWCNCWWNIASVERPVVQHYQLPTASYRDAVWPDMANPSPLLPCFWNGVSHPDEVGHMLFGDVVTYGLLRSLSDSRTGAASSCNASGHPALTKFHPRLTSARYCPAPPSTAASRNASQSVPTGTFMTAATPSSFQPLGFVPAWSFREDRPSKPGWILEPGYRPSTHLQANTTSTVEMNASFSLAVSSSSSSSTAAPQQMPPVPGNVSNSIWFRVRFSSQPQLQVTYLASYRLFGIAQLAIYSSGSSLGANSSALATYLLDGRTEGKFSIPRTTVLVHPSTPGQQARQHAERLPNQVQQGEYVVAIRPINGTNLHGGQKFKLLGIASC